MSSAIRTLPTSLALLLALCIVQFLCCSPPSVAAEAAPPLGEVTVQQLDGTTLRGRIDAWREDRLVLATADRAHEIVIADLLTVRAVREQSPREQTQLLPLLRTIGGSAIPIQTFSTTGREAVFGVGTSPTTIQELRVPLQRVHSVRLQPLGAALRSQWEEILALAAPNDVLVLLRRDGQSLDYLEGVIGKITDESISFQLDDERVEVPRGKVAGLIYYRKDLANVAPCRLIGDDELRINAKTVRLDADTLRIATTDGLALTWPWDKISTADFSAGKLAYLSDLPPVSQSWQPLVALPRAAKQLAKFGEPRFDQSATGSALSLWFPERTTALGEPSAESGRIQVYDKGLAIRSRTELVLRLPSGYRRLVAVAGIEPATRATGNVLLTIEGDDEPLMEVRISGHDAPLPIELNVAGVRRLQIVVDYGDNLDTGDWLNLCNARIVK